MKSADFRSIMKLTETRFQNDDVRIYIGKNGGGMWSCVVEQDGDMSQTGPQAKTKMEMYSILPQVAEQWGFSA